MTNNHIDFAALAGTIGTFVTSALGYVNLLLATVTGILSVAWYIYRFRQAKKGIKVD